MWIYFRSLLQWITIQLIDELKISHVFIFWFFLFKLGWHQAVVIAILNDQVSKSSQVFWNHYRLLLRARATRCWVGLIAKVIQCVASGESVVSWSTCIIKVWICFCMSACTYGRMYSLYSLLMSHIKHQTKYQSVCLS